MGQQGRLCVPCQIQPIIGVPKRQFRDVVPEDLTGLRINVPGDSVLAANVAAHPGILGPLAGESEEDVLCRLSHGNETGDRGEIEE